MCINLIFSFLNIIIKILIIIDLKTMVDINKGEVATVSDEVREMKAVQEDADVRTHC